MNVITQRPILGDEREVARLADVSTRHLRRLADAGRCPQPVRLGRSKRWNLVRWEAWIADGCPDCRRSKGGVN